MSCLIYIKSPFLGYLRSIKLLEQGFAKFYRNFFYFQRLLLEPSTVFNIFLTKEHFTKKKFSPSKFSCKLQNSVTSNTSKKKNLFRMIFEKIRRNVPHLSKEIYTPGKKISQRINSFEDV